MKKINAKNINDLAWTLNRARTAETDVDIDVTSLPTWGTYDANTMGIFSWDTTDADVENHKILIFDDGWRVTDRF